MCKKDNKGIALTNTEDSYYLNESAQPISLLKIIQVSHIILPERTFSNIKIAGKRCIQLNTRHYAPRNIYSRISLPTQHVCLTHTKNLTRFTTHNFPEYNNKRLSQRNSYLILNMPNIFMSLILTQNKLSPLNLHKYNHPLGHSSN